MSKLSISTTFRLSFIIPISTILFILFFFSVSRLLGSWSTAPQSLIKRGSAGAAGLGNIMIITTLIGTLMGAAVTPSRAQRLFLSVTARAKRRFSVSSAASTIEGGKIKWSLRRRARSTERIGQNTTYHGNVPTAEVGCHIAQECHGRRLL